jgi:hypothetical protein
MRHRPCSQVVRIKKAVGAASVALALSVIASPVAAADPAGSPTPSASASDAASPSPTASPDPSITLDGTDDEAHSQIGTTADSTVSPTPEASVTSRPAEQQSPSQRVKDVGIAAVATVSGVLRDATTGAPIRNSCVGWRPKIWTGPNETIHVDKRGRWSFDAVVPGSFYIAFYVTEDGNCSNPVLTGKDNYRASWYRGHPFFGTDPSTAVPPRQGADAVPEGSDIVACLGTQDSLPTECTIPDRTVSGRVVGVGPVPIGKACIVAIGANDREVGFAISDADGRWTMSGLPINYDFVVGVAPPFRTRKGPCTGTNGPPPAPPPGALQPEFYDDTWADFSDPNLNDAPFTWATDPNSPHPAVALRNSRTGIDVCLTTETGRDTPRGSCDPAPSPTPIVTPTVIESDTDSSSTGSVLAATGGPSLLIPGLGAALILAAVVLLARSRWTSRRLQSVRGRRT